MQAFLHVEYLKALEEAEENASGGPWHVRDATTRGRNLSTQTGMLLDVEDIPATQYRVAVMSPEDAMFVSAARDAVPRLLAENWRLRALLSLSAIGTEY